MKKLRHVTHSPESPFPASRFWTTGMSSLSWGDGVRIYSPQPFGEEEAEAFGRLMEKADQTNPYRASATHYVVDNDTSRLKGLTGEQQLYARFLDDDMLKNQEPGYLVDLLNRHVHMVEAYCELDASRAWEVAFTNPAWSQHGYGFRWLMSRWPAGRDRSLVEVQRTAKVLNFLACTEGYTFEECGCTANEVFTDPYGWDYYSSQLWGDYYYCGRPMPEFSDDKVWQEMQDCYQNELFYAFTD